MSSIQMHNTVIRNCVLTWGPVLVVMAILFFSSAQPKHVVPGKDETIYFSGAMPIFPGGWDVLIKKSSHMIAYGLLAGLNVRALRLSGQGVRRALVLAVAMAAGYAITDEVHQSFVVGRSASIRDIGFDLLGAALACWLINHCLTHKNALQRLERRVSSTDD